MARHPEAVVARRHRLVAALVAVSLGLLGALLPAVSASAAGSVTGRVVDQLTPAQPAVGLSIQLTQRTGAGTGDVYSATTDSNGVFNASLPEDELYEAFVPQGSTATDGQRFSFLQQQFTVAGGLVDLGDLVVNRYVPVSGTITNWSSTMGDVRVDLFTDRPGYWQQYSPHGTLSSGGTFTIYAPILDDDYTLRFLVNSESAPYADAFLGGGYTPEAVQTTRLDGVPGVGFSGLTMEMPDAAVISGRVTDISGVPLPGIWVWAEDPTQYEYTEIQTDINGDYTLYVQPDLTYLVEAEDWDNERYASMIFDGVDPCGCDPYTPVEPTLANPATGTDFELFALLDGVVLDDTTTTPIEDVDVRLYKLSTGGTWVFHDNFVSIPGAPNFGFTITSTGHYRLQFFGASGHILAVVDGLLAEGYSSPELFDPVPACYAELGELEAPTIVIALIDPATLAGVCAALDAVPPPPPTPAGATKKPRATLASTSSVATPTPTPSATPTASATPRPSTSPTPSVTPVATEEPPASAPDFWWLLWVGIGILLIVIVGGVVYFVRRA